MPTFANGRSPVYLEAKFNTHILGKEIMVNHEHKNGLKVHPNLAQSNTLGLRPGEKIVRTIGFIKETLLFQTKRHESSLIP